MPKRSGYSVFTQRDFMSYVSFNKLNAYAWHSGHAYELDVSYDPHDRERALTAAAKCEDRIPPRHSR